MTLGARVASSCYGFRVALGCESPLGVLARVRLERDGHAVPRVVGEAAQVPHLGGAGVSRVGVVRSMVGVVRGRDGVVRVRVRVRARARARVRVGVVPHLRHVGRLRVEARVHRPAHERGVRVRF